jgi:hypothetical protein
MKTGECSRMEKKGQISPNKKIPAAVGAAIWRFDGP